MNRAGGAEPLEWVVGIDLSGPGSARHTSVAVFRDRGPALELAELVPGADDRVLLEKLPASAVVGLDAPLSYSETGGSREADTALRRLAIDHGLPPGTVMAPSAPRMVYLTLRGVAVSRMIGLERPGARVVEVHPTAAMALRGAPVTALRAMKTDEQARRDLLVWLQAQGLEGVQGLRDASDHSVAACAAALAAWQWSRGEARWLQPARPPLHPCDFAC